MAIKDVILGYAKGEKGDPGPRGEKGNTGATGPKGDPGNIADAQITDTEGLDVAKGQKTTAQKLFDAIANRIVTKLVTNDALTKKLADYMLKGMMSNTNVNNTETVPTSALMYSMFEQINNNLGNTVKYLRTDNIDNAAETLWPKIEESSSYDFTWIPETGEGVTKGAQARVIGFYSNSNYESQMILSYLTSAPVVQREKINGSWGNWKVFATKSDLDILENRINNTKRADDIEVFADSCNLGLTSFICYAETKGLPSSKYTSGAGLVLKRKQENVTVFLIASSAIIALKCRSEGGWGNWREI